MTARLMPARGKERVRLLSAAVLGVLIVCAAGCRTVRVVEDRPVAETTLMVTRAGDTMTLSWNSQPGVTYIVLFAGRRDGKAKWQPLPGAERVRGTGGVITLQDRVPASQARYYRVQLVPAAGR